MSNRDYFPEGFNEAQVEMLRKGPLLGVPDWEMAKRAYSAISKDRAEIARLKAKMDEVQATLEGWKLIAQNYQNGGAVRQVSKEELDQRAREFMTDRFGGADD